jgi:hypothetical protein
MSSLATVKQFRAFSLIQGSKCFCALPLVQPKTKAIQSALVKK